MNFIPLAILRLNNSPGTKSTSAIGPVTSSRMFSGRAGLELLFNLCQTIQNIFARIIALRRIRLAFSSEPYEFGLLPYMKISNFGCRCPSNQPLADFAEPTREAN